MDLPDVDVVGAEAAQARVEGSEEMTARGVVTSLHARPQTRLRRDQYVVARNEVVQQAADHLLGHALAVDVGRVDEVATDLYVGLELGGSVLRIGVRTPGHGAQRESRDEKSGAAERTLLHGP